MSTIVYRDGVLAADSRAYAGYNLPLGSKFKIRALQAGGFAGVSTRKPGLGEAVLAFLDEQGPPPEELDFMALCVKPDGSVYYFYESLSPTGPLDAAFFAIGSGAEAALGAMHMGADAVQAVDVATKTDAWSAAPIHMLKLEDCQPVNKKGKSRREKR